MSATSSNHRSRRPPPAVVRFAAWIAEIPMSATAHHVALTMARYAHADGTGIEVGVERIARDAKLKPRAVQYAQRELEELELEGVGVLLVVRKGGGRNRPTVYRLNPASLAPYEPPNGASSAPLPAETVHLTTETVHQTTLNGASSAPEEGRRGIEEVQARAGAAEPPALSDDEKAARIARSRAILRDPKAYDFSKRAAEKALDDLGEPYEAVPVDQAIGANGASGATATAEELDAATDGDSVPAPPGDSQDSQDSQDPQEAAR